MAVDEPMGEGPGRLGPTDLSTFVISLGSNVLLHLGLDPHGDDVGGAGVDLGLAEHTIGILVMLEAKTRGNLTSEEAELLSGVLYQTRVAFLKTKQQAKE